MRTKLVQVFGESTADRITQTVIMQEDAKRVALQKQEILMRFATTVLGLIVTFGFSFYGLQWILNAMDPTKQDKKEAQKRVCTFQFLKKTCFISHVWSGVPNS